MVMNLNFKGLVILLIFGLLLSIYPPSVYSQSDLVPVSGALVTLVYSDGSVLNLTTDSEGRAAGIVRPGLYSYINVSGPTIKSYEMTNVNIDTNNNLFNVTVERSQWVSGIIRVGTSPAKGIIVSGPYVVLADSDGKYAIPVGDSINPTLTYSPMEMFMNIYGPPFWELMGLDEMMQRRELQYFAIMYPSMSSSILGMNETINMSQFVGQEVVAHDVDLQQSLTISGVVTDENGVPIANASIFVYSFTEAILWGYATTDANGNYQIAINVKDGERYVLMAAADGYGFLKTNLQISGNTVFNIQLKRSSVIKGHVTDANGNPISDIEIYAISKSGWMAYAYTDSNGYYELSSGFGPGENVTIMFGEFNVASVFGIYGYKAQSVVLNPGENVVDLVYDIPMITISGVVDDVDREGLLEQVYINVTLHTLLPMPIPSFLVPVMPNGSFSVKMPTTINLYGFKLNISTVDISVSGTYYYPSITVATELGTDQDIVLGTIQIVSHPVIDVTFYIYTPRSSVTLPDFHHEFKIKYKHWMFPMTVDTNSSLSYLLAVVAPNNGSIQLKVVGPTGTKGYLRVTVPKAFLGPPYTVYIDGVLVTFNLVGENATHVTLEIIYSHSEHDIMITSSTVIPEFPLELLTIFTMLLAAVLITMYFKRFI